MRGVHATDPATPGIAAAERIEMEPGFAADSQPTTTRGTGNRRARAVADRDRVTELWIRRMEHRDHLLAIDRRSAHGHPRATVPHRAASVRCAGGPVGSDWDANMLRVGITERLDPSERPSMGLAIRPDMRHHAWMSNTTIDPVASPAAYQTLLLSLLGDDDPAIVQAATEARLRDLVAEAGPKLRVRPEPTEWSVLEGLGHIVDAELVVSGRVRWILAEDEPDIVPYDQDRWVNGLRHREDEPEDLLALFVSLRTANLRLWATRNPNEFARIGIHRERGPESYELTVRLLAGHDRFHIAQIERTLAAVTR